MILHALPALEAEKELDRLFNPKYDEDSVYNLALRAYDDPRRARSLARVFGQSRVS